MLWLIIYVAALFASALFHSASDKTENYFIFGRKAGAALVCFSLLASCIGGSATIGMLGLAWEIGFPAFWWLGVGAAGLLVLGLLLSTKVRKSRALTMPQILAASLGDKFRRLAAIIIFFAYLAIMAAQFEALQVCVSGLTGLSPAFALPLGVALLFAYTALGGQAAVIKSDVWQFAIIVVMLGALLAYCLCQEEGQSALASMRWELVNASFPPSRLVYFFLILGGSFVVGPMLFGRILSAKDEASAKKGACWAALGLLVLALIITCTGAALRGFQLPAGLPPQEVFGVFTREIMPGWAHVPILLGMFSVIVSSADSCLFTVAAVCANDLVGRPSINLCRWLMLLVCVLAYALTLMDRGILKLLLMANDIYVCGLVAPFLVAMLAEGKRVMDRCFVLWAMLGGGATGFLAALLSLQWLSFAALGIALLFSLLALHSGGKTGGNFPD